MIRFYVIERPSLTGDVPYYLSDSTVWLFNVWTLEVSDARKYKTIAAAGRDIRRYGLRSMGGVAEVVRAPE